MPKSSGCPPLQWASLNTYPSPWYNRNGWLGVKHKVTYLLLVAGQWWTSLMPKGSSLSTASLSQSERLPTSLWCDVRVSEAETAVTLMMGRAWLNWLTASAKTSGPYGGGDIDWNLSRVWRFGGRERENSKWKKKSYNDCSLGSLSQNKSDN